MKHLIFCLVTFFLVVSTASGVIADGSQDSVGQWQLNCNTYYGVFDGFCGDLEGDARVECDRVRRSCFRNYWF